MKISLCAFADEASPNLDEQIYALKRNGIKHIELRGINGENVSSLSLEKAVLYAETLKNSGIKVWSIGSPLGKVDINSSFDQYCALVEKLCKIANIFDCDKIRAFSFFNAYESKEKVIEYLKTAVEIAKKYSVEIYHENEKDVYGDVVARVEDIMKSVEGLKFVYDPANFVQVGESKENFLPLVAKCDYYHIKDALKDGSVVPSGCGEGGIDQLIELVDKDTVFTVEPHLKVFDGYSAIDDTKLKNKYVFTTNNEAFDFAVIAIKALLLKHGFKEEGDGFYADRA